MSKLAHPMPTPTPVRVKDVVFGGGHPVIIAGPCSVESEEQLMTTAEACVENGVRVLRGGAFKPRSSPHSFQGLGVEGLRIMQRVARRTGLVTVTEAMSIEQIALVAEHADIIQIGTRNMFNFALLKELGKIRTPVLLKRGFMATIEEFLLAVEYLTVGGNSNVILCERGIRTFDTITRNTLDLAGVAVLKRMSPLPVIVDPSHGTGRSDIIHAMALAAIAGGADGLMVEVHPNPAKALSDGLQSLDLPGLAAMAREVKALAAFLASRPKDAPRPAPDATSGGESAS
jgi:3-deoxy-7-phosphoheptulonate synthase